LNGFVNRFYGEFVDTHRTILSYLVGNHESKLLRFWWQSHTEMLWWLGNSTTTFL